MNRKWQKILTTAVCCSLLISPFNGISAVAETLVAEKTSDNDPLSEQPSSDSQEKAASGAIPSSETATEQVTIESPQQKLEEPQLPPAEEQIEQDTAEAMPAPVKEIQEAPTKR